PDYPETSGMQIAQGRFCNDAEDLDARQVVVLGPDVSDRLFPKLEPLGQEVRIRGRPYAVVGVLERRGKLLGLFNMDNVVVLPMNSFLTAFGKHRTVSLNVQAREAAAIDRAQQEVERVLRQRRAVDPNDENNFEIATNESMAKTLNDLSKVITAATFGVCLLSLLV